MMMNRPQAQALAALVHALRPDWDPAGIMAALRSASGLGESHEVAIAAVSAAAEKSNRTPAVIALDGLHWRRAKPDATPTPGPGRRARCTVYGHEHYPAPPLCAGCRSEALVNGATPAPREPDPRELAAGAREEF